MTPTFGVHFKDNPKEYRRLQSLARRRKHPIRYLISQIRYRAKMSDMDFDIHEDDFTEIPETCPILGIPLFQTVGGRSDNSYSIDRVDNSKGYVKGNCRIISLGANMRKGDLTIVQVENLLAYMKKEK